METSIGLEASICVRKEDMKFIALNIRRDRKGNTLPLRSGLQLR